MYLVVFFLTVTGNAYDCPPLIKHTPTKVQELHPNDIDVVLALGDSITAGFGIAGASGLLAEYRGQSWAIGGDENATTVPNFLKFFNPDLVGFSVGKHFVELCYGPLCPPLQHHPKLDVLNAAQSGAMIGDVRKQQVKYLVKQMKSEGIDIEKTWKHITLLIGANDLCVSCLIEKILSPDEWEKNLREILDEIKADIPRAIVSVVEIFNVSQVYDLSLKSKYCTNVHRLVFIECDCAFGPKGDKHRVYMDQMAMAYNNRTRNVVAEYNDPSNPNFAAVIVPATEDLAIKDAPLDFLSTLDCFHPSLHAHQIMAINLWNTMLTPIDQKEHTLDFNAKPMCPTNDTLIYV